MCGIAGFIDFNSVSQRVNLENMTDALLHRGPDAYGYSFHKNKNYTKIYKDILNKEFLFAAPSLPPRPARRPPARRGG